MDGGFIIKKLRVSLERFPAKGYLLFWAVDSKTDGSCSSQRRPAALPPVFFTHTAAPWPAARRSSQSSASDHYTTRNRYQSTAELKAISPDKKMEA
jgi:hypothetical protein